MSHVAPRVGSPTAVPRSDRPSLVVHSAAAAARRFPNWEGTTAWEPATIEVRIRGLAAAVREWPGLAAITVVYESDGAVLGVVPLGDDLHGFAAPAPRSPGTRAPEAAVWEFAARLTTVFTLGDLRRELGIYSGCDSIKVLAVPRASEPVLRTAAGNPGSILGRLLATYSDGTCNHAQATGRVRPPQPREVEAVVEGFLPLLFPGYRGPLPEHPGFESYVCRRVSALQHRLTRLVRRALAFHRSVRGADGHAVGRGRADRLVAALFDALPRVRRALDADIRAAYRNDPAIEAGDQHLVPLAYPGLYAVTVYRLAHELHRLGVPYIPRMATEAAHSKTGIDIHPGATIGSGFFIDHGTGVVIGETAVVGNEVTVYQGVTLGALNFPQDAEGNPLRGAKRHPTVRGGTTVYANAAVLGPIEIGHGSKIGANVSLRTGVQPESVVRIPSDLRKLIISCVERAQANQTPDSAAEPVPAPDQVVQAPQADRAPYSAPSVPHPESTAP